MRRSAPQLIINNDFKIGGRIMKNTEEGATLTVYIEDKMKENTIEEHLLLIIFSHIKPQKIRECLTEIRNESFEQGKKAKQDEICQILGIYNY